MSNGFDHITSSCFTLCANHCGTFADPTQSFSEIAAAADEGDTERMLFNVVGVVGGSEDFGFVNVVYPIASRI